MVRKINLKESEKPNISITEAKKIAKELLEAKLNNPNYLLGDINGDKKVNADDAANAIEIFKTNSATIEKLAVGDMNYDGTINAEDAALIIEYFKTHN